MSNVIELGEEVDVQTNNVENPNKGETVDVKSKRKKGKTSTVWDHFKEIQNDQGQCVKASCNYCGKIYEAQPHVHGTTSLRCHLAKCKTYAINKDGGQNTLVIEGRNDGKSGNLKSWKFDEYEITKAIAHMVIVDELPFGFVEKNGFKYFLSKAQPLYKPKGRLTIANECFKLYLEEKEKLMCELKKNIGRICLTTDTWSSLQRINYMVLTAHYIANDWNLRKIILIFCPISSYKGADIGKAIENCLIEWDINSVLTVTVDIASSNDSALRFLKEQLECKEKCLLKGKWIHVRCVAHIMNLIVQEGLSKNVQSVERIRAAVKYVRHSPKRVAKFRKFAEFEKCDCTKNLVLDVPTRWNSTFMMLDVAHVYEKAFRRFDLSDPLYRETLMYVPDDPRSGPGLPTSIDWDKVRKLVKVLEPFYDLTLKASCSKSVSAHSFLEGIVTIDALLKQMSSEADHELYEMAFFMKGKFDKYFGLGASMNMLLYIACVLDPRYKLVYLEVLFGSMFGKFDATAKRDEVQYVMYQLFDEYVRIHSPKGKGKRDETEIPLSTTLAGKKPSIVEALQMELRNKIALISGHDESRSELDKYLREELEVSNSNFDILGWWKMNSARMPILSLMARDILATPISTVASESTFSISGRILDAFRSSLTPRTAQALICAQDWLRASDPLAELVEETWEELQAVDEELTIKENGRNSCLDSP